MFLFTFIEHESGDESSDVQIINSKYQQMLPRMAGILHILDCTIGTILAKHNLPKTRKRKADDDDNFEVPLEVSVKYLQAAEMLLTNSNKQKTVFVEVRCYNIYISK